MPDENPYKPPAAPVRDTGPRPQRSLTLAVLAGLGVGVGGSILSRVIVAMVYVTLTLDQGGTPRDSVEALSAPFSTAFIMLVGLGCVFSVLGGYVCARVARRHERRVTVVLAVLSAVIGFSLAVGTLALLVHTLTFVSVMVGGGVGRYRNLAERRQTAPAIAA